MNLQAHAVTGTVTEVRAVPCGRDHRAAGGVDAAPPVGAVAYRGDAGELRLEHDLVHLPQVI